MPNGLSVTIRGIPELKKKIGTPGVAAALRPALTRSGLTVQAKAQTAVHSPDNPYVGKAGVSVATGRLQASLGTSDVMGSGLNLSVRVGTPYGKGGVRGSTFARSSRTNRKGRTGGRKNTSDVNVYGPIEERRHPFLVPSLESSEAEITNELQGAIDKALR